MAAAASWPQPSSPEPDRTLELYKLAVEEYRFQATFNWQRTQYLLALNAAILAAATAVAARPGRSAALVFALGLVTALLSQFVIVTQRDYYRAARARVQRFEDDLGLPPGQRVDTTSTLGGRERLVSVVQVVQLLFAALAVAHLIGIVVVLVG